jgi:aspartate-semialdehyde dehydrogenase
MGYKVAIVGATGAVGVEMLKVLERRRFPVDSLRLIASPRSAGRRLRFSGDEVAVEPLSGRSFEGIELVLMSAGASVSREHAPRAQGRRDRRRQLLRVPHGSGRPARRPGGEPRGGRAP